MKQAILVLLVFLPTAIRADAQADAARACGKIASRVILEQCETNPPAEGSDKEKLCIKLIQERQTCQEKLSQ